MTEKLQVIIKAIEDKKGINIVVIDISKSSGFSDYMVIATGRSIVNTKAITDEIENTLDTLQEKKLGMEGYEEGKWILIDYDDVIIHLFEEQTRRFYNLEYLWKEGKEIYKGNL